MAEERGWWKSDWVKATASTVLGAVITLTTQQCQLSGQESTQNRQHQRELRERSYARLMGLKQAWTQGWRGVLEAKAATRIHYLRYGVTKRNEDLEEAKAARAFQAEAVTRTKEHERQLFEALAEIRLAYDMTPDLEKRWRAVYGFKAQELGPLLSGDSPMTVERLADLSKQAEKDIAAYIQQGLEVPLDNLLGALEAQAQGNR